ncbi:MAG: hypothetical protein IIA23_11195 [Chloroflexi bacterium]|nr:hypothetical protein [Chloroflexota bacterium]
MTAEERKAFLSEHRLAIVGVERTQIGSPADLRQQAPAPGKLPPGGLHPPPRSQVPKIDFENDPLGSIGLILAEFAAGFAGKEGPIAKAEKLAIERQGLQLRRDAQTLNAIRLGVDQFEHASAVEMGMIAATIGKKSPEAGEALKIMAEGGVEDARRLT